MKNGKAKNTYQVSLFDRITPIDTVVIQPTKEMPIEVFREFWEKAYFTELMDHLPDGRVLWDEERTDIFDPSMADIEYLMLQNEWFSISMEIPKKFLESFLNC